MIEPALSTATPAPEEDVTTALYRAAIGPVSGNYYLPIFTRFEAANHAGISWNNAASLVTLNWLVFRKLWVAALAYVGILVAVAVLVFGVGHLVFQFSDTLMMALGLGFGLAAFVLPGLFGNAVLHTECRRNMSKALTAHTNVADACDELARQASTRRRAIWLAAANAAFLLAAVFAYLQISALSTVAVMPQGALEAGHVAVGGPIEPAASGPAAVAPAITPSASASSALAPATSASAVPTTAPVVAASAPMTASSAVVSAASAPAPAASNGAAQSPASAPALATSATSAPAAPATKPITIGAAAPVTSAPATAASVAVPAQVAASSVAAPASKPAAKSTSTAKTAKEAPAAMQAVQVRAKKEPEKPAAKKAIAAEPKSNAKAAAAKAAPAASASTTAATDKPYYINVGLFAKPENATNAHAKLIEAKLPSVITPLKQSKHNLIRVRVGPFTGRAEAEAAVEKIKALELDAVIIQL